MTRIGPSGPFRYFFFIFLTALYTTCGPFPIFFLFLISSSHVDCNVLLHVWWSPSSAKTLFFSFFPPFFSILPSTCWYLSYLLPLCSTHVDGHRGFYFINHPLTFYHHHTSRRGKPRGNITYILICV